MSGSFQCTFKRKPGLNPDIRKVLTATHEEAKNAFRKAAKVFVETLAAEVSRHQDTGMSYASLFTIAREVNASMPPLRSNPPVRKGMTTISEVYYPERFRDQAAGEALGAKAGRIQYGAANNPRYNFVFNIMVYQYFLHEFGLGVGRTDEWASLSKARTAMNEFLDKHMEDFVPHLRMFYRDTGYGLREPGGLDI